MRQSGPAPVDALGFSAAIVATLLTSDAKAEASFHELTVRANTGLGAAA